MICIRFQTFALTIFLVASAGSAQSPATVPEPATRFAYVFGSMGQFVKIDTQTARLVSRWWLHRIPVVADNVPPYVPPSTRTTAGFWSPIDAVSDPFKDTIFIAVPTDADDDHPPEYRVLSLQTPMLEMKGNILLPSAPTLFIGPGVLFVNHSTESTETRMAVRLESYDAESLKRTKRYSAATCSR
jgi:hypothetical protein